MYRKVCIKSKTFNMKTAKGETHVIIALTKACDDFDTEQKHRKEVLVDLNNL